MSLDFKIQMLSFCGGNDKKALISCEKIEAMQPRIKEIKRIEPYD